MGPSVHWAAGLSETVSFRFRGREIEETPDMECRGERWRHLTWWSAKEMHFLPGLSRVHTWNRMNPGLSVTTYLVCLPERETHNNIAVESFRAEAGK